MHIVKCTKHLRHYMTDNYATKTSLDLNMGLDFREFDILIAFLMHYTSKFSFYEILNDNFCRQHRNVHILNPNKKFVKLVHVN